MVDKEDIDPTEIERRREEIRRLKIDSVVTEAGGEPREKAASEGGPATTVPTDGKTSIH